MLVEKQDKGKGKGEVGVGNHMNHNKSLVVEEVGMDLNWEAYKGNKGMEHSNHNSPSWLDFKWIQRK